MGSFGDKLRREREMRGITLDEISASTKISRRHLEELEAENFDALPGGIFNRGFVRAYARFLGIDEDQAVADYVTASGEQSHQPEPAFPIEVQEQDEPQLNPRRSSLPLILALIALVIVLGVFWARSKRQPEVNEAASSTPAPASTAASTPPITSSATPSPVDTIPSVSPATTPSASASPAVPLNSAASSSPFPPAPAERTFTVMVEAKEDAWVMLKADGKTVFSGKTMKAGDQQIVHAGKSIVLVTGNAGGVDVSFNGKPLGSVGNESEVRTLTFTPAGLVQ